MFSHPFISFSHTNRRLILLLLVSHLLWSCGVLGLWAVGPLVEAALPWWSVGFVVLQLYGAAQLLRPALLLQPEERTRGFYLFWGAVLALYVWLGNQLVVPGIWQPLLAVIKSGLLLLVATLVGVALARYVNRLWEILPICMVMALADFASWFGGPTADFADEIKDYYLAPEGPPPIIDMVLVKLAFPGSGGLAPLFGISDWIMVVFFASVAQRFGINDNLFGASGVTQERNRRVGCYLPVSVVALFVAILLAQATGLFIPALPVIALSILIWYSARSFLQRRRDRAGLR